MKCPKCGSLMRKIILLDTGNYIKRKLICKKCKFISTTYEFLAEDLPADFLSSGTRVLIGDSLVNVVPGIYLGSSVNSIYPHLAIDDDGELMGKYVIGINWGVKEL